MAAESMLPDFADERYAIRYGTTRKATYDDYGVNGLSGGSSANMTGDTTMGDIAFGEGHEL